MKEKRLNDVYMREVHEKIIKTRYDESLNAYITIKYINKTSQKCTNIINGKRVTVVDDGYIILEYSPIEEKYNVRVFIDNKQNILKYYFDIISEIKYENSEIYYMDLYLDVIYDMKIANGCCNYISLVDENELIDALNNEKITKKQFDDAYQIANVIMDELLSGTNKFVNRKIEDLKQNV